MNRVVALALLAAAACSSDGDDRVDAFVGTWSYGTGSTSNFDCDNDAFDMMSTVTGNIVFAAGTETDLIIQPAADDECPPVKLDVSGSAATASGNTTCTLTQDVGGMDLTSMSTVQNLTVTLDETGTRIDLAGQVAVVFSGAATATCTASIAGNATKTGARTQPTGLVRIPAIARD